MNYIHKPRYTAQRFCTKCNLTHTTFSHFDQATADSRLETGLKRCIGRIDAVWMAKRSLATHP